MEKIYIWVENTQNPACLNKDEIIITQDGIQKMISTGHEHDTILHERFKNMRDQFCIELDAMYNDIVSKTMNAVATTNDVDCIYSDMDEDQPCWGKVTCVGNDSVTGIPINACKGHAFFIDGCEYFAEDQ